MVGRAGCARFGSGVVEVLKAALARGRVKFVEGDDVRDRKETALGNKKVAIVVYRGLEVLFSREKTRAYKYKCCGVRVKHRGARRHESDTSATSAVHRPPLTNRYLHKFHPSPSLYPLLHTYLVAKRLLTHSWLLTGPPALHRAARTRHQSPSGAWAAQFLMVLHQHTPLTFISTASACSRAGGWRRLVAVSVCA